VPRDGGGRQKGRVGAVYRGATQLLAWLMIALGASMLLFTLSHGGGVGVLLGALFVAAGAGRLYLLRKRSS
jgi:hypothetical protein